MEFLILFLIFFFSYRYSEVISRPPSKRLAREIELRNREKRRVNIEVQKHRAVARYNRRNNRTRSNSYGGKYRRNYDGY